MSNSKLRIEFQYGGSVREIYPDPYGQTYDSHLICSKNPKTVQKFALDGLRAFVECNPYCEGDDHGVTFYTVYDFVNAYVAEKSKGRWKTVRWNSKSYPD